jgi:putative ABC transport system permease protein
MAVGALVLALIARLTLHGIARFSKGRGATLRLALANLARPGSGTASVAVALGAGLAVLSMVAVLRVNLATELADRLPERAPAFFFIDIQPDQADTFREIVAATDGAAIIDEAPMLRGRVVRIDGQPLDAVEIAQDVRWTVSSDRGLTYRGGPPDDLELVRGAWWPTDYDGPPLVSIDEQLAAGYGVDVGDTLAFNVLGRVIEAEIASTRNVEWESVGMNWLFIMSPGVLDAAPHTWVVTVDTPPGTDSGLIAAVSEQLPNVTPISVREIVGQLAEAFGKIALAVSAVGALTLVAGILVLAGAIAAARRRHLYEAVVLKVLGARRVALMKVFLMEYLALGLVAGVAGALLGTIGAWVVVVLVMDLPWTFAPGAVLQVVGLALIVTFAAGFLGTWRLLGRPAAPVLRTA